jgi:copper chaperone CopZ
MIKYMHMRQVYSVKGMHCGSCVGKVGKALSHVPGVTKVNVLLKEEAAEVESIDTISLESLSQALAGVGKYTIAPATRGSALFAQVKKLRTFLPLILIFSLVILWTLVRQYLNGVNLMDAMLDFMGGFFLLFGALKVINWQNFVAGFRGYDPIAMRSLPYANLYPIIEVLLGIAYQFRSPNLLYANLTTIVILSATTYGVVKKLRAHDEVKCVCLGGFFSIPLSGFTVFENVLMIVMAGVMLLM